jgi:hypothetical protein
MSTNNVEEFVDKWMNDELGRQTKHGRWSVLDLGDISVLRYAYNKYNYKYDSEDDIVYEEVAYKFTTGGILVNSNELHHAGVKYAWGRQLNRYSDPRTDEQKYLENNGAIPFPFTLFTETGMSVVNFSWIVKPVAETVTLITKEQIYETTGYVTKEVSRPRHFTGACVFKLGEDTYLFDVDRQELSHGIFNAFLTKLPSKAFSIEEAYDVLTPTEVLIAQENAIDVKRQGEFFFIKHSDECPVSTSLTAEEREVIKFPPSKIGFGLSASRMRWNEDSEPYSIHEIDTSLNTPERQEYQEAALKYKSVLDKFNNINPKEGSLGKSATGSHTVSKYVLQDDIAYVSGTVKQSRREHADLILKGWYRVVANTAVTSWTITGKID